MASEAHNLQANFDHTAFAVRDALACGVNLRRQFGATPILGEALEAFRYLTMYVGSAEHGTNLEFLDPTEEGFLTQFLDKRGQSPHHITFLVSDVPSAVAAVCEQGFGVVDEDYEHAAWHEAFIRPDATHRTIIQLAGSDRPYPSARELLATTRRDALAMPHIANAKNRDWWTSIWDTQAGETKHLGPTVLQTTDMPRSHTLFGTILQGQAHDSQVSNGVVYSWPGGAIELVPSDRAGIAGIRARDDSAELIDIDTIIAGMPNT
ncbi:VOC family protein [Enteractinococcus helveticum]|uniref:VOC domain-containing protein n=1 Tax=Enteractinococcus helveticum TaxID=1837282 RepID=A0A1B7LYX4_9MICC|nr:VOC family protein [Enteractinococcus helveticum]OAV60581.1 hypothetical protein A6F49_11560 [Enteractinococcus helveticum]